MVRIIINASYTQIHNRFITSVIILVVLETLHFFKSSIIRGGRDFLKRLVEGLRLFVTYIWGKPQPGPLIKTVRALI